MEQAAVVRPSGLSTRTDTNYFELAGDIKRGTTIAMGFSLIHLFHFGKKGPSRCPIDKGTRTISQYNQAYSAMNTLKCTIPIDTGDRWHGSLQNGSCQWSSKDPRVHRNRTWHMSMNDSNHKPTKKHVRRTEGNWTGKVMSR